MEKCYSLYVVFVVMTWYHNVSLERNVAVVNRLIVVIRVRTLYYFVIEENCCCSLGVLLSVWRPGIEPKSLSTEPLRLCFWNDCFAIQCFIVERFGYKQ